MLRLWYKTHERRTADTSTSKPRGRKSMRSKMYFNNYYYNN